MKQLTSQELWNTVGSWERREYHQSICRYNLEVLSKPEAIRQAYPHLWRIIGRKIRYLVGINEYAATKWIGSRAFRHGLFYFFVSCRYLASKYGGAYNTWNRNLNTFCTLGLLNKYDAERTDLMTERRSKRNRRQLAKKIGLARNLSKEAVKKLKEVLPTVNYFTVPVLTPEKLAHAEEIAKAMIDEGFTTNGFSKIWLIKAFGSEEANRVFDDDRYITDYSEYVAQEIETFILREIEAKGFTTKDEILRGVKIERPRVPPQAYGFFKSSTTALLAREFDRGKRHMLARHGLVYRKANRELLERFGLATYKTIICLA